ncbi:MAG: GNAT family N-acetyltransferase [Haloferacaceae archaeon]
MTAGDLVIDRLTGADVDAAHDLSDRAGWDTRPRDWRRLVDLDAVDAFAGRIDGALAATATLVRYGSRVSWIGMMLVRPASRRQGCGTRMLRACLDAAAEANVDVVGLDANDGGKPLYDAHGFVAVADVIQWRGAVAGATRPKRVTTLSSPDPVAAFDRRASGVDRRFLLASLLDDDRTAGLLRRGPDGSVAGYALVRRRSSGWTVGPLVAARPDDAGALVRAASTRTDGGPFVLNAVDAPGAMNWSRRLGFDRQRSLTRMTYRHRAEPLVHERIRAITAFEYG